MKYCKKEFLREERLLAEAKNNLSLFTENVLKEHLELLERRWCDGQKS